jgi:hypothetical protein
MIGAPTRKIVNNGAYHVDPSQVKFIRALYAKFNTENNANTPPMMKELAKVNPSASNEFFIPRIPRLRTWPTRAIMMPGNSRTRKSFAYVLTLAEVLGNAGKITAPIKEKRRRTSITIKMFVSNLAINCSFGENILIQIHYVLYYTARS